MKLKFHLGTNSADMGFGPSLEKFGCLLYFFATLGSFTFNADLRVFGRKTKAVIEQGGGVNSLFEMQQNIFSPQPMCRIYPTKLEQDLA